MTLREHTGVWVSDRPLDCNEGADGGGLLTLTVPVDVFEQYEWIEEGKPYREALIPAAVLNALATPRRSNAVRRRRREPLKGKLKT